MKRREVIKCGIGAMAAAMIAGGCKGIDNSKLSITPKQTATYKISAPLPFEMKVIDEMAELNEGKYKKLKLITLYNNIPLPTAANFNQWLQVAKSYNGHVKTWDDFAQYAKYAIEKGFKVCYLLNSPKPFNDRDYATFRDDFLRLLDYLKDIGISEVKVGNAHTAAIVNKEGADFKISTSTALEFHNLSQYENFLKEYKNVKLIDIAIDENHNFHFLKNLKKLIGDIDIELMTDESCTKGCPARISHISELGFCKYKCENLRRENPIRYAFRTGMIYPWNLEYYSAIGINNFKLIIGESRTDLSDISPLKHYFDCVEYGPESYKLKDFMREFIMHPVDIKENITVADVMDYFLDVNQFIQNGDKCATRCRAECHYCESTASRFEELLKTLMA